MRKHIPAFLATAFIGFASPIAMAQFSDNFETSVATPLTWQAQQANPALRTDNDPAGTTGASSSAVAGQWFHGNKSGVPIHDIQVTNVIPPGAAGGTNYLRIHRGGGADTGIAAAFTDHDAGLTSGIVTAEWDMFIPANQEPGFVGGFFIGQFVDNDHGTGTIGSMPTLFIRNSGVLRQSFNFFGDNPDLASPVATPGEWEHYVLTTNLDAGNYTLSIDGVTSAPAAFNYPILPNGGAKALWFSGQEGGEMYIDNLTITVPEPAAFGLLSLCALPLLRRRRSAPC